MSASSRYAQLVSCAVSEKLSSIVMEASLCDIFPVIFPTNPAIPETTFFARLFPPLISLFESNAGLSIALYGAYIKLCMPTPNFSIISPGLPTMSTERTIETMFFRAPLLYVFPIICRISEYFAHKSDRCICGNEILLLLRLQKREDRGTIEFSDARRKENLIFIGSMRRIPRDISLDCAAGSCNHESHRRKAETLREKPFDRTV